MLTHKVCQLVEFYLHEDEQPEMYYKLEDGTRIYIHKEKRNLKFVLSGKYKEKDYFLKIPHGTQYVFVDEIKRGGEVSLMPLVKGQEHELRSFIANLNCDAQLLSSSLNVEKMLEYQDWFFDMQLVKGPSYTALFLKKYDEESDSEYYVLDSYHYETKCNFAKFASEIEKVLDMDIAEENDNKEKIAA